MNPHYTTWVLAPPSWEAVATAFTGILAVLAAVYVGRKQIVLQARQAQIAENEIKIQLLEARMNCIEGVSALSQKYGQNHTLDQEDFARLHSLMQQIRLLFPQNLIEEIARAFDNTFWSERYRRRSLDYHQRGKVEKAKEFFDKWSEAEEIAFDLLPKVIEDMVRHTKIDAWG